MLAEILKVVNYPFIGSYSVQESAFSNNFNEMILGFSQDELYKWLKFFLLNDLLGLKPSAGHTFHGILVWCILGLGCDKHV